MWREVTIEARSWRDLRREVQARLFGRYLMSAAVCWRCLSCCVHRARALARVFLRVSRACRVLCSTEACDVRRRSCGERQCAAAAAARRKRQCKCGLCNRLGSRTTLERRDGLCEACANEVMATELGGAEAAAAAAEGDGDGADAPLEAGYD